MSVGDYERRERARRCGLDWNVLEEKLHQYGFSFYGDTKVDSIMNKLIRMGEFFDTKERLFVAIECGASLAGGSSYQTA